MIEQLTLVRPRLFLRIENGDLGEEGLEPKRGLGFLVEVFGVLLVVLQWNFGLMRGVSFVEGGWEAALVLQRKRGVEGLLPLNKRPNLAQLLGLGLGLGICS